MYLLIDDVRNFSSDIIARTAKAGKLVLKQLSGHIDELGIDHDLTCLETGYNVVLWAIENDCLPDKVQVISMNPVGRKAIVSVLLDNGYQSKDNTNFVREGD